MHADPRITSCSTFLSICHSCEMTMRICVCTGSRAEYGLLLPIMRALKKSPRYKLQVLVCASHLLDSAGRSVSQIEADGLDLFEYVKGDRNSIMGLPIKEIKSYINSYKNG